MSLIRQALLDALHLLAALITGACIAAVLLALFTVIAATYTFGATLLWFGIGVGLILAAIVLLALYERRA